MAAYLVFNELSIAAGAPDPSTGKQHLDGLAQILVDPRITGKKILVAPSSFIQLHITPGYAIGRWLREYSPEDSDRRLRVKTLLDRRIGYNECVSAENLESDDVEYKFFGENAQGLSTAILADGLCLSVLSNERWDSASISIQKSWVAACDVETCNLEAPHACRAVHLDQHLDWLGRIQTPLPANGQQLWDETTVLFPNLDFCDSVEAQIKNLGGDSRNFRAVMRGLYDLEKYCHSWSNGGFDIHALNNASGESGPTLEMYDEERKFWCPDGVQRVFEWHLKRGDIRIHFFDFPSEQRLLVGYVGPHLRTALHH